MGWPLRMLEPNEIQFVTARCFQGRLLLRPSNRTNDVLGGVLARAARLNQVEVFGFVFASNHFHLLVRAPQGNLPEFMKHLRGNISKKVGWLVGWEGSFWERRYSVEPVLDDGALEGRLRYMMAHGVKEGLVRRCQDWPGLSSLSLVLANKASPFRWFGWTERWRGRTRPEAGDRMNPRWSVDEPFELTPLPRWANSTLQERRRRLNEWAQAIEREGAATFGRVLGRRRVLAQNPLRRVERPDPRPRPLCHTTVREFRMAFIERWRSFVAAFRAASQRWLEGDLAVVFPPNAYRPFLKPRPRLAEEAALGFG